MTPLHAPGPGLVRTLPFALFIAVLAVRAQFEGSESAMAGQGQWLYAAQAGIAALLLMMWWRKYGELRGPAALWHCDGRALVAAVLVGLAVFALWVLPDQPWMRLGGSDTTFVPLDGDGQRVWPLIAMRAIGAVLVVPLMEELFWRSFLMRWIDQRDFLQLDPRQVSVRAWWASSAVFALAHDQWLVALVAGLAFGWIYRRSGRIWLAVLAHAVANLALALWVVSRGAWVYW